tara:strand:- start:1428 stop:1649 length:222 start_codon:yes stop_codon:yes gene_type:complete
MAKKKAKAKKVEIVEIEVIDPIVVEEVKQLSEKDQIKLELKEIGTKLNGGYDVKFRSSLLERQMKLQIKLKSL